jgi:glycosyltransferase involved in cell wall biosynthesis
MAAGLPVLTSDRGALAELAGEAGLLVDPEQTEAIRAGIDQLLDDEDHRRRLAEEGRRRSGQFTWERAAAETMVVYRELQQSEAE